MDKQRLIRSNELAKRISIPLYTIRKLVRDGVIPAYRLNKRDYLFDEEEVLNHIKGHYRV